LESHAVLAAAAYKFEQIPGEEAWRHEPRTQSIDALMAIAARGIWQVCGSILFLPVNKYCEISSFLLLDF
jgi:hypothetical protein